MQTVLKIKDLIEINVYGKQSSYIVIYIVNYEVQNVQTLAIWAFVYNVLIYANLFQKY